MSLIDRRDFRIALLTGLVAFLVYNANLRLVAAGDTLPARFLPLAVWKDGSVYLDNMRHVALQKHQRPYWVLYAPNGHWASMYPVVTPLLVSPIYAPGVIYLHRHGWSYDNMSRVGALLEKLSSSTVAATAVGLMFLVLRRRVGRRDALLLTAVFAFATGTWSTSSQALWQHGPAELFLVVALWCLTGEPTRGNLLIAGFAAGLLVANRPPDVLLAAGLSLYALVWARWRAALFALAAAVPVALFLFYNLTTFHRLAGGYAAAGVGTRFFGGSILEGIAGLLFSPAVGLFVFCPFFLFLPFLFHRSLREERYRILTLCLAGAVVCQILLYARTDWRAGFSYGPRFLVDAVPILVWMLAPVLASLGRGARIAFAACGLFAAGVQYVGAFHYTGISSLLYHTERSQVWNPAKASFLIEARTPRQPAVLLRTFQSLSHPVPMVEPMPVLTSVGNHSSAGPLDFYTVQPCRAFDSRPNAKIVAGEQRTISFQGCGVPDHAGSVAVNFTTADATDFGHLRMLPESSATVPFAAGQTRAYGAILPLDRGSLGVRIVMPDDGRVHLIVDVVGYFAQR
ncbi:MAG TPA: hypothetical protein VFR31_13765 [Thermoanaerobaculia bacterium]|nr:hypothetical protein [Thermoanaerobaculia bacterium]